MKILTQVWINSENDIDTQRTGGAAGRVDKYGAWEELDYSLSKIPPQYLVKTTESAGQSTNGAASWRVSVPTAEQRQYLSISKFPSIMFFDVQKNAWIGRIDGNPQARGTVYAYLVDLLKKNGINVTNNTNNGTGGAITPKKAGFGLAFLGLLFAIKKPKQAQKKKQTRKRKV
jgi:hypothetical protein